MSWRKQLLLNIVMLRYADTPVFLEVGQVISGYDLEGTISAGGTIGNKTAPAAIGDFVNLGAGGRYLDRPTVTYSPLTGPDFIKTMIASFPPDSVMFLIDRMARGRGFADRHPGREWLAGPEILTVRAPCRSGIHRALWTAA
jgi:hypothetical protein